VAFRMLAEPYAPLFVLFQIRQKHHFLRPFYERETVIDTGVCV